MKLEALLDRAVAEAVIGPAEADAARRSLDHERTGEETPWFLHVLIGAGAWLSALFLLGFMGLVGSGILASSGVAAIVVGGLLTAAATQMRRKRGGTFIGQRCLSFSLAGQGVILMGVAQLADRHAFGAIAVSATLLAALLYAPFPDKLHRFLTCAAAAGITIAWLSAEGPPFSRPLVIIANLAAVSLLFAHPRANPTLRPLGYALALSLAVLFLPIRELVGFNSAAAALFAFWSVKVALAGALIWVAAWAMGGADAQRQPGQRSTFVLLVAGILLLSYFSSAGILTAIFLLALGYGVQDRLLMSFGALLLPVFVCFYYYHLPVTLLQKSVLLMASGAVLLAVWGALTRTRLATRSMS
jgi:hypothetical protein